MCFTLSVFLNLITDLCWCLKEGRGWCSGVKRSRAMIRASHPHCTYRQKQIVGMFPEVEVNVERRYSLKGFLRRLLKRFRFRQTRDTKSCTWVDLPWAALLVIAGIKLPKIFNFLLEQLRQWEHWTSHVWNTVILVKQGAKCASRYEGKIYLISYHGKLYLTNPIIISNINVEDNTITIQPYKLYTVLLVNSIVSKTVGVFYGNMVTPLIICDRCLAIRIITDTIWKEELEVWK